MKKSMFILTLMVAALCGFAAQQPTTLEPPETSVLVEVTPETSSGATPTATPARLLPQPLHLCSRRRHRSKYP